MSEIKGKISIVQQEKGSKSQGAVALLHTPDGSSYTLYREDTLPQDDPYFTPLHNSEVIVSGEIEDKGNYICVSKITLPDATELLPPPTTPSPTLLILDATAAPQPPAKSPKRLPRKLKKQIKKSNNK